ncbi:hypothetical protein OCU04_011189 [Sclerotinia nivalis]|nr:hypothetical protein OCU04_011189 [Sclerotinia nivalis]
MRRTYSGPTSHSQVADLNTRLFGTWTFVSFILRTYAAYNMENREIYTMALWKYGIALAHFVIEWLVFETMSIRKGIVPSLVIATVSMGWMMKEWSYYVDT